jgi:AbrB family looped-hinge helix DNA binding protein
MRNRQYDLLLFTDTNRVIWIYMKATGIVRRVDDLGRIVIPKEIRRTLKIREGDPLLTTLTPIDRFCWAIHSIIERTTR